MGGSVSALPFVLDGEATRLMPTTRDWGVVVRRQDGHFAVIGDESGGVYASREEFEADDCGGKAESHAFC
jgi:hypothetical protein